MEQNDLVSVIMGIYNIPTEEMLDAAISSILNQTYKKIEFVIVDDGSTNNTYKWANCFAKKDNRIKLLRNEKNMGLAYTLNVCLKNVSGKYIARMDGDDISHLDRIEKQLEYLKNNKSVQLVGCNINKFDEEGFCGESHNNCKINKNDFLYNSPISHPTIFTYKEVYDKVNGYSENKNVDHVEDYDLFFRMYLNDILMENMTDCLYDYRENKNNYKRRKYKYRINEAKVRAKYFSKLKMYPKAIPYVIKPLIVGIIPLFILKKIKKGRY